MFKKLLKAGTTILLILGCYYGYVQAFGLLVDRFKSERGDDRLVFPARDSRSKRQAYELCLLSFGPDHWTVKSDKVFAYYNTEQRFWMFSLKVDSVQEENGVRYNGKRLRLDRVAIIFRTNGGKSTMTVTADSATLDLNQAIALSSKTSGDGIKVVHAHFEGDVRIRDDRGTPADPADDLNVLPLAYLDFDDGTQQITTASQVVMIDPDQKTIGDGLEIQLRAQDPRLTGSSSSSGGFAGVKYAILKKNVRVHMRDVGSSGFLPGTATASTQKTASGKVVEVTARTDRAGSAAGGKPGAPAEPMPLYIQSDGPMRIDVPPDQAPVAVGPPAPPAPTLVRFERNVVALHGRPDRQPNQLDCDTLRLTLIPGAPPAPANGAGTGAGKPAVLTGKPAAGPAVAVAGEKTAPGPAADSPAPGAKAESQGGQGIFGNLTLQKAHATGHVVWLQLRQQGTKVRCGELIHHRRMPYLADSTTFRGDRTRPVWMEKTDYEKEEEKKPADGESTQIAADSTARPNRTVRSVTHVVTLSATLFDQGHGLDLANVRALGPGTMESRPSMNEPVERLAKWQDELVVVNYVGDDGKLARKKVTLTGTRPYFADLAQETSLDAGRELQVWLRPQSPATATPPGSASPASALAFADSGTAATPPKTAADSTSTSASTADTASTGLGGNLQIERLMAYRDVHLRAPNRRIDAREVLDAPFIEVDPPPPETTTETAAASSDASSTPGSDAEETASPGQAGAGGTAVAAAPSASGTPAAGEAAKGPASPAATGASTQAPGSPEPAMTGVADRIWAKVALPRGQRLDSDTGRKRKAKPTFGPPATLTADAGNTASPSGSAANSAREAPKSKSPQARADVREAWLTGNVALHQTRPADPRKKGSKPGKQDIFAEAVSLDNPGKGKAHAKVYHRNPTETVHRPGPLPLARVATDDMTIDGEYLELDQARDMVWAVGPGTLTQLTDPALLSDKAPAPAPSSESSGTPGTRPGTRDTGMPVVSRTGSAATPGVRTVQGTGLRSPSLETTSTAGRGASTGRGTSAGIAAAGRPADSDSGPGGESATAAKPRTRAGRPVKPKDLMTITWTKKMTFNGRSKDTVGHPAGRGDFLGVVRAEMTDSLLYCEQKMIVFTDREVPLADLGTSMPGSESDRADEPRDPEIDEDSAPRKARVNLAMLFCYGNPVAINRKVDPDLPVVLERQKIIAWDRPGDPIRPKERPPVAGLLQYNRITGQFFVPGPGMVFLYNRPEEAKKDGQARPSPAGGDPASSPDAPGATTTGHAPARGTRTRTGDRTVVPTSAVASDGEADAPAPARGELRTASRTPAEPASPVVRRRLPDLVLTQVEFSTGMRGRVGSGQATDTRQERWSEFFGDIELIRSKVANEVVELDADQELSDDGFYLTSQMLRIVETPPPPGSPAKAPARTLVKAWDGVQVNKGLEFTIVSDVGTYDSQTDVLYAYGEGGRGVTILQQAGPGQPPTRIPARAVQYGFKSRAWRLVDSNMLHIVDHRTGARPGNIPQPDPTAPPRKKLKQPYRVPNTNLERRGFTGF